MESFIFWFNLFSGICSISGYTVLGVVKLFSKSKYMKVAVIKPYVITTSILFLLSLLFTYKPWSKIRYGDEKPKIIHDTIKAIKPDIAVDDTSKKTSIPVQKEKHIPKNVKKIERPNLHEHKKDTTKTTATFSLPNATFNAPSQFGYNNTQNNQFGLKPREVTEDIIEEVKKQVADKGASIEIYRVNDEAESYGFSAKILKALNNIGYTNVLIGGTMTPSHNIGGDPEAEKKRLSKIQYSNMMGSFIILVPPNN
jgi:hypothetical protein